MESSASKNPFDWFRTADVTVKKTSELTDWGRLGAQNVVHERSSYGTPGLSDHTIGLFLTSGVKIARYQDGRKVEDHSVRNDVMFAPAMQPAEWTLHDRLEMFHLFLPPELLSNCAEELDPRPLTLETLPVLRRSDAKLATITNMVRAELASPMVGSSLFVDSLAVSLAVHILRTYSNRVPASPNYSLKRSLDEAKSYLDDFSGQEIRLYQLAKIASYETEAGFLRAFSKAYGLTPHQYLLRVRISKAKTLISSKLYTIGEIALITGFCDQAHLTTSFKKLMNLTPQKYQQYC